MPAGKELLIFIDTADAVKSDGQTLTDGFCLTAACLSGESDNVEAFDADRNKAHRKVADGCKTGGDTPVYWRVLPKRNLLQFCCQGEVRQIRQLEPRLMHLLCLLAAADGDVLTRDTLMETLWPRVVVNENSLTRAVSELRRALNVSDSAVGGTISGLTRAVIETVPKRGYRLNATLIPDPAAAKTSATGAQQRLATRPQISSAHAWVRFPAFAAAMVISAVLSALWTVNLTGARQPPVFDAMLTDTTNQAPVLEDRVLSEPATLPEGLQWLESVHNQSDSAAAMTPPWFNATDSAQIAASVLAPGGQMMAFVEQYPGQSQLKLRSLLNTDDAWTVFTSSSPITHLQWSPLDAGLLFTVEDTDGVGQVTLHESLANGVSSGARLSRLMLLDLETLQVRELYRRIVPSGDDQIRTVGSLT